MIDTTVSTKRIFRWSVAAVAGALLVAAVPKYWLLYPFIVIQVLLFPSTISWDGHAAAARCLGAISSLWGWPSDPVEACFAMHLCANEAVLSDWRHKALYDAIHRTPGCPEP
jgi:hypothetical protein